MTEEDGREVWLVYESVFGDYPSRTSWLESAWAKHSSRNGFRLACADDDDRLVGFAYGYVGEAGYWWTDNARDVLENEVAAAWLGGDFEVVSIGVVRAARGAGVGRALLRALTEGLRQDRLLLMTTSDPSDPARRLYTAEGRSVIGPGIGDGTVIMGKQGGGDSRRPQ